MNEKFALGFHTCVDYELCWNTKIIEEQIIRYRIAAAELKLDIPINSERDIWIISLAHLKEGIGCEVIPEHSEDCNTFAEHFDFTVTMGGTPTRAAIILERFGHSSILQTSCYNSYVNALLPKKIHVVPGKNLNDDVIYPHVVLQCKKGIRIRANDIDFTTPRENRILISRDEDSMNMPVLQEEFGSLIKGCEVFLLGSFTEILDFEILKDRIEKTKVVLQNLSQKAVIVMEDGCYCNSSFRTYVHSQLALQLDILSMNEDEMQQYIDKKIDILNPKDVRGAIEYIYKNIGVDNIIIHSAEWALAYGKNAYELKNALEGGVIMASTRFRIGDEFTIQDYENTKKILDKVNSVHFCRSIMKSIGEKVYCIPCKDLSNVKNPTIVGLGDSFAGGMLPHLIKNNMI